VFARTGSSVDSGLASLCPSVERDLEGPGSGSAEVICRTKSSALIVFGSASSNSASNSSIILTDGMFCGAATCTPPCTLSPPLLAAQAMGVPNANQLADPAPVLIIQSSKASCTRLLVLSLHSQSNSFSALTQSFLSEVILLGSCGIMDDFGLRLRGVEGGLEGRRV
jgi:hypothetical protein